MEKYHSNVVPIFFAVDDAYAPFLGVALKSLLANASQEYHYDIHILTPGLNKSNTASILKLKTANSDIAFDNMSKRLENIAQRMHLRDYYSIATYYRLFIAELYPQYDKVLYFDSDMVFLDDISKLYTTDIGDNLVGAVIEEVMTMEQIFGDYVEIVLNVPCSEYFNAGMLVMNTYEFRQMRIEERFINMLGECQYKVTQDQDYLNVLCRNKVVYFDVEWNKTPEMTPIVCEGCPKIVHYKLNWKPWHYDDILYSDYFWQYAAQSGFEKQIKKIKRGYLFIDRLKDRENYEKLKQLAAQMINDARHESEYEEVNWLYGGDENEIAGESI